MIIATARRSCTINGCITLAVVALASVSAEATVVIPLASYEPAETALTVTSGDSGLTVARVEGGVGGAPPATDGTHVLRLTISNEADLKVEFRHFWQNQTYTLADRDTLLADLYITSTAALPGVVGIFEGAWSPPDAWQSAMTIPTTVGAWTTVRFDVSTRNQANLDQIWAFVLENLASPTGEIFVDNLRFEQPGMVPGPVGVAAVAREQRIEVYWRPLDVAGVDGYRVFRAASQAGPFTEITTTPISKPAYFDSTANVNQRWYYRVSAQVTGQQSDLSSVVSAQYNGLTDAQLMDLVQEKTFGYFWDYGHPVSGMAREGLGFGHPSDTVTTGGTGMGLMTIMVAVDRGFITRAAAAARIRTILAFLETTATRYHGAFPHHLNGTTGATIPFSPQDNGGDLVETSFLIQGMLAVRQYFDDPVDPVETELRERATRMWHEVEWDWYLRVPGGQVLYWHWSPNFGWAMNLPIRGYNETQIVYLLAAASPTHPIPASTYLNGWAGGSYVNGTSYYGINLVIGPPLGGPMFFTHYSNLGNDPRFRRDSFVNYFEHARKVALVDHAYCIDNPQNHLGYGPLVWGLTASFNPWGYSAHAPDNDNGTITPTAAISSIAYVPDLSLRTMRHWYDTYPQLFGTYGFKDAFNLGANWYAPGYLAIDQGTIATMIENHRTGLCWRMFMANAEIAPALASLGFFYEMDYDRDGDVDLDDYARFADCIGGPGVTTAPSGCFVIDFLDGDTDADGDLDLADFSVLQDLIAGP